MLSIHKHLFNVIFFSAVFACCQLSMLVHAQTVGTQKSETGIRHSFLVTGSITAIIGEDNQVKWQVPGRSRDGFVLSNGNVLRPVKLPSTYPYNPTPTTRICKPGWLENSLTETI
jgi:hypothetical protein